MHKMAISHNFKAMLLKEALSAVVIGTSSVTIYLVSLYRALSRAIEHSSHLELCETMTTIKSLPSAFRENMSEYRIVHDIASTSVPALKLQRYNDKEAMLTSYIRRNMMCFSRFPQAWAIYYMVKSSELQQTFKRAYIQSLDFQVGDVVCGVYRVELRSPNSVELGMAPFQGSPPVDGLLVIEIVDQAGQLTFRNETLQWARKESLALLPLEQPVIRWLHNFTTWWLLDTGCKFLSSPRTRSS